MALSPPSQFSGYAPGSIAGRPTVQKGGMRGKNEDPAAFRARMDARKPMAIAPGGQTRQDRVIASRMDGTFEAKRNTFNAANANVQMDEAGNIGPKAAAPPVNPVPPVNTVTPPASQASPAPTPAAPKPPAGGTPPLMKPVGKIDGKPASLVLEGMKSGSPSPTPQAQRPSAVRPPITRTAGGELVQPGTPMNPNARWQPPVTVTPPSVTAGVTPPVTRNAPVTPSVTPRAVTPLSPTENKQFTALGQAMQLSQATQGPMPRAVAPPPTPAPATPPVTRPAPVAAMAPTAPPASPAVASPAPRAVAPPLSKPKTLAELKAAADAAKAARQPGLTKVGNTVASGVSQLTQGGSQLAQTINTAAPLLATSVAGSIESAGKTALSTLDNTLAPARNWLSGSKQKSPEELAYEEALATEQKKKKAPGVPAVTPRPGSSAPQPFSAAALGANPRAVMPPSITMLGR